MKYYGEIADHTTHPKVYRGGVSYKISARDYKSAMVVVYDARGNGGGGVAPTITGDHENSITDYTAVVVEVKR